MSLPISQPIPPPFPLGVHMFVLYVCTGVPAGPELRLKTQTPLVQQTESVSSRLSLFTMTPGRLQAHVTCVVGVAGGGQGSLSDIKPLERKCTLGRRRWGRTQSPAPGQASLGS